MSVNIFAQNMDRNSLVEVRHSVTEETFNCRHPFKINSAVVDSVRIRECFNSLNIRQVSSFKIYASASPEEASPEDLMQKRKDALTEVLKKYYPNVPLLFKYAKPGTVQERSSYVIARVIKVPTQEHPDFAVWAGGELYFIRDFAKHYNSPIVAFTTGASKGITQFNSGYSVFYGSFIFDYGKSVTDQGQDSISNHNYFVYGLSNWQFLLGWEQYFSPRRMSLFFDLGPEMQTRTISQRTPNSILVNNSVISVIGGTANIGLRVYYDLSENSQIFVRAAINAGVRQSNNQSSALTAFTRGDDEGYNPFIWGPNLSIGFNF